MNLGQPPSAEPGRLSVPGDPQLIPGQLPLPGMPPPPAAATADGQATLPGLEVAAADARDDTDDGGR